MATIQTTHDSVLVIDYTPEVPKLTDTEILDLTAHCATLGPTCTLLVMRAARQRARGSLAEFVPATELAAEFGLGQPQLSRSLNRLERFGLVTIDHTGRITFHRFTRR